MDNVFLMEQLIFILRMVLACLCGGSVGFERKRRLKEAGIRTHLIVALGACVMMIISKHGFFDLSVQAKGDLHVDGHHTVEDVGIVLGQAIRQAVGDKAGMKRFGYFILPMDDALALCAVDLGGRAYFSFDGEFQTERVGDFETQLVTEFFYALASNAQMNLHIRLLAGQNDHHKIEAIFKAFGKALDQAVSMDERISGVLSTKGSL